MAEYILALDQGTTSSRAVVFDKSGAIVSVAQKEFTQIFPKPGWVEHDATEIWSTQAGMAAEAVTKKGLKGEQLAAIGITNQRETAVVWDKKTSEPIYNAIVWQDKRTSDFCDELKKAGKTEMIREKILLHYKQEIPYSVEVVVEEYKDEPKLVRIRANIIVSRDSQKVIIIGKGGQAIKRVGTDARKDIQDFVGKKVFYQPSL